MAKKKETYSEFKARIEKEGFYIHCIVSHRLYVLHTPDGRKKIGTIEEIKSFIGE